MSAVTTGMGMRLCVQCFSHCFSWVGFCGLSGTLGTFHLKGCQALFITSVCRRNFWTGLCQGCFWLIFGEGLWRRLLLLWSLVGRPAGKHEELPYAASVVSSHISKAAWKDSSQRPLPSKQHIGQGSETNPNSPRKIMFENNSPVNHLFSFAQLCPTTFYLFINFKKYFFPCLNQTHQL